MAASYGRDLWLLLFLRFVILLPHFATATVIAIAITVLLPCSFALLLSYCL